MGSKLNRPEVERVLESTAYNLDGSVAPLSEKVRNYRKKLNGEGKVEVTVYSYPVQINVDGEWEDIETAVTEEAKEYLVENFTERHMTSRIILDTQDIEGISVRGRERVPNLIKKLDSSEIRYPREFTWVDGASDISGVIELPYDDYSDVYVASDLINGEPDIVFVPRKVSEEQERPYYTQEDGKTFVYVSHFSGGGGIQSDPYLVETEDDLDKVREKLSAYYIQTADIVMAKNQTGEGFKPIGTSSQPFTGFYDGRGFSIANLYINSTQANTGLFGRIGGTSTIKRLTLFNVNVTGGQYTGALIGFMDAGTLLHDCIVKSGTVLGKGNYTGGAIGYASNSQVYRIQSHADVATEGNTYCGGLIGQFFNSRVGSLAYSLSTGKVQDSSPGKTGKNIGAFIGNLGSINSIAANFYDSTKATIIDSYVSGATTVELSKTSTYKAAGWDFALRFKEPDPKINNGYPNLRPLSLFERGRGIKGDPYRINSPEELLQVTHFPWASFELENDIDLSIYQDGDGFPGIGFGINVGWAAIDTEAFQGQFDGAGYSIGGLYINQPTSDYLGLFRYTAGAEIKNLTLIDVKISGRRYCGALVGSLQDTKLSNIHLKEFAGSRMVGTDNFGGLLGQAFGVELEDASVTVNMVSAGGTFGGIVGNISNTTKDTIMKRVSVRGKIVLSTTSSTNYRFGGLAGNMSTSPLLLEDIYVNVFAGTTNNVMPIMGGLFASYVRQTSTARTEFRRIIARPDRLTEPKKDLVYPLTTFSTTSHVSTGIVFDQTFYDRDTVGPTSYVAGFLPKYTVELQDKSTYNNSWNFESVWNHDSDLNNGVPELRVALPIAIPGLGIRDKYGNYYTDAKGDILRYLDYGIMVAGVTTAAKQLFLQNNSGTSFSDVSMWTEGNDDAEIELSAQVDPFTPEKRLELPELGDGESHLVYARLKTNVAASGVGYIDLFTKATPK
ncbi:hypothetical protein [Bacillus pumilus]|uniref:hypothetical protein n=1 Tax=Bacillus pumilus TaxID=1408 RepID=UPI0011E9452D|nr:hypothetical protein [Bacillus pumilus]TYS40472.1 hypothetical protein FZC68_16825 [Bacillus pumilus]